MLLELSHRLHSATDSSCSQTFFFLFQAVLSPLIAIALKISQIHERTGRRGPTVITWMKESQLARAREHAAGNASPCLFATCLCLLWLWKTKSYFAVGRGWGGVGWVKDGWEKRKKCFVLACPIPPNAKGSLVICWSYTIIWYLYFITLRGLFFWEKNKWAGKLIITAPAYHWCHMSKGSKIIREQCQN
jgi:hypothetical protein